MKIKIFILVMAILGFFSSPILALEQSKGNIEIQLTHSNSKPITFQIVKVASISQGTYQWEKDFTSISIDLNSIQTANQLSLASQKVSDFNKKHPQDSKQLIQTNSQGHAKISNLESGVYLLDVENSKSNQTIQPTLVSIPTWNEETGTMDYDITIYPKYSNPIPTSLSMNPLIYYGLACIGLMGLIFTIQACKCFKNN